MIVFFNHDTPNVLKERADDEGLHLVMSKIYTDDVIEDRIKEIAIADKNEDSDDKGPTYKQVFFSQRYRRASWVGIAVFFF